MPCGICNHEEADEYLIPSGNHEIIEIDLCLECSTLSNEEIIEKVSEEDS